MEVQSSSPLPERKSYLELITCLCRVQRRMRQFLLSLLNHVSVHAKSTLDGPLGAHLVVRTPLLSSTDLPFNYFRCWRDSEEQNKYSSCTRGAYSLVEKRKSNHMVTCNEGSWDGSWNREENWANSSQAWHQPGNQSQGVQGCVEDLLPVSCFYLSLGVGLFSQGVKWQFWSLNLSFNSNLKIWALGKRVKSSN